MNIIISFVVRTPKWSVWLCIYKCVVWMWEGFVILVMDYLYYNIVVLNTLHQYMCLCYILYSWENIYLHGLHSIAFNRGAFSFNRQHCKLWCLLAKDRAEFFKLPILLANCFKNQCLASKGTVQTCTSGPNLWK